MKIRKTIFLAFSFVLLNAGCAIDLKPWQRGDLAKAHMSVEPDALKRIIDEQIATSKEAASGGFSVVGGGCGCN